MLQKYNDWDINRFCHIYRNYIKSIILIIVCLLFSSSNIPDYLKPVILPIQCSNDPYLDKILDSLRYEESSNGKRLLNINYKKGKEVSRDEGPYQLNSKNKIVFANAYNNGKMYNSYNEEVSRQIARQIIIDNYRYTGNMFTALVTYNCGITGWIKGAPYKSYQFADRIMKRLK